MIMNIETWVPVDIRDSLGIVAKGEKKKGHPSYCLNNGRLSPLTLYCYLKSKFGPPNGIQMLFKKPNDSDNLIHWHYTIRSDEDILEILGMNTKIEFWLNSSVKVSESDWDDLINRIKQDFKNQGPGMSAIRKDLEHWWLFINPYSRFSGIVSSGVEKLKALDIENIKVPDVLKRRTAQDEFMQEIEAYTKSYTEAGFLCATLRLVAPVYAESFVNLLIFLTAKPEVKADERLYQDLIRKQIDVRVKSLPLYCHGFKSSPDDTSVEFKAFLRLMNHRNDILHGNIDPQSLKFDEVWFDGYTPLFKDEKLLLERATYHSLKHIEPTAVMEDVQTVETFIEYLMTLLEPNVRQQVELLANDPYPGWREETGRVGKLFSNLVADISPVFKSDES
jgi:hypothetical protein